jgi:hypothetical protein
MLFVYGAGMSETLVTFGMSPYQMLTTEQVIMADATGGNIVITLPPSTIIRRSSRYVKKIDSSANTVTVNGYGSDTIDGAASEVLSNQWDSVTLLPNG